jgi:phosphate transport system substrate-binding protein
MQGKGEDGSSGGTARAPPRSVRAAPQSAGRPWKLVAIVAAVIVAGSAAAYVGLVGLGGTPAIELARIDGSSTVYPITAAWAGEFNTPTRQVVVAFSGTGGGFQKFCRGEIDLSDASRPIKASERDACIAAGITGITEFLVGYDGLTVVVNEENTWANALTVKELCRIWTSNTTAGACGGAGPRVTLWNDINSSWPDATINLYGPGTDSGTFDYFVEEVLAKYKTPITDAFFGSEDDNVLVQAIAADPNALGYFGYAYYLPNEDRLKAVGIDDGDDANGAGPILPSEATIKGGTYRPLSRPLFIYASAASLGKPLVKDFLRFGFSAEGTALVAQTGYVTLTSSEIAAQTAKIPA